MNTPEWIEYTGSDEQIAEMRNAKHGWIVKYVDTDEMCVSQSEICYLEPQDREVIKEYLICQPHPYADLIKIWRLSGCPVWVRPRKPYEFEISDYENHPTTKLMTDSKGVYLITTTPDWNIPAEYSLTPFED